ncbi:hypothetical protein NE237_032978 [Protea cynaroides]|uniref:Malectin domain-containing protein n=1 Tax=Protea cynaroides TaxID=273540 RepID=A0A9Q0L520_9MAGN|nr:hypothetical protein NE237_032978 [Protea cynaroides]
METTLKRHFAEIMFTNDQNYNSLGRCIFDVYIQGQLELKDFNIVNAAGGAEKADINLFTSVGVTSGTLEIRFYWAGKGTTAIPSRGTYGPLISAITVDSEFPPPSEGGKISAAAVIGFVALVVGLFLVVLGIF